MDLKEIYDAPWQYSLKYACLKYVEFFFNYIKNLMQKA